MLGPAAASVNESPGRLGIWLLALCALLLVWHPISFALTTSAALEALSRRGLPLGILLSARVAVTGLGVAAGLSLARRKPAAVALTTVALISSALLDVVVYTTPYFPNNRIPGDTPIYIAWSLLYHGSWLLYLRRSKHVREIFT